MLPKKFLQSLKDYSQKCCVGFSYGLSFPLTLVILDYWLKDIGVSNSAIGLFTLLHWPFTLKFFWGVFIENYDIPGLSKKFGRNRSWLLVSYFFLIAGVIGMAYSCPESCLLPVIISASVVTISDGCKDVVIYPYQIGGASRKRLGYIAGSIGFGYRMGFIAVKVMTLHLAHLFSWRVAYLAAAFLIFLSLIPLFFLKEPSVAQKRISTEKNTSGSVLASLGEAFSASLIVPLKIMLNRKDGLRTLAILMLYKGADFMMQKMSRPFCLEIGFSKLEIANIVQFFGSIAVIIGGFLGGYLIKRIGIRRAMIILGLAHGVSFFSYTLLTVYGHNTTALCYVILLEGITGGSVTAAFLAFIYSLCKIGSQYALLWAFHELGGMFFMSISGFVADSLGWVCYFSAVPFVFAPSLLLLKISKMRYK
jgi:PAT family beta-lactamase induction signal transducer AmpG